MRHSFTKFDKIGGFARGVICEYCDLNAFVVHAMVRSMEEKFKNETIEFIKSKRIEIQNKFPCISDAEWEVKQIIK